MDLNALLTATFPVLKIYYQGSIVNMESKKRLRGDEVSELDPLDSKRAKPATGHNLHSVAPIAYHEVQSSPDLLLDEIDADELVSEARKSEVSRSKTISASSASSLHQLTSIPVSSKPKMSREHIDELLSGFNDDQTEEEAISLKKADSPAAPLFALASASVPTTRKPLHSGVSSSLFSKASSMHTEPQIEQQILPSPNPASPRQDDSKLANQGTKDNGVNESTESEPPGLVPMPEEKEEEEDEFEAILAAAKAKRSQPQTTRQLHNPIKKAGNTSNYQNNLTGENTTSLFLSARSLQEVPPQLPVENSIGSITSLNNDMDEEEEFEAMMAAVRAKTKKNDTFKAPARLARESSANNSERTFNHLSSSSSKSPEVSPSSLFKPAETIQSEESSTSSGSSSLFTSARNIRDEDFAAKSLSLFQPASREMPEREKSIPPNFSAQPSSTGSSSLFTSVKSIRDEEMGNGAPSLFQVASREQPKIFPSNSSAQHSSSGSSSLFTSARNIRDEENGSGTSSLFQVASRETQKDFSSTSLFSTARSIRDEESGLKSFNNNNSNQMDVDETDKTPQEDAEEQFELYLSRLSSSRTQKPTLFNAPRSHNASSIREPNHLSSSASKSSTNTTSLFQPAKSLSTPNSNHLASTSAPIVRVDSPLPNHGGDNEEEDEFEAFLSKMSAKRSAPAPITQSNAKSSSSIRPSPNATSNTRAKQSSAPAAPAQNQRKFKAPALISPAAKKTSSNDSKRHDDEVHDALLSLLEEDDDEEESEKHEKTNISEIIPSGEVDASPPLPKSPTVFRKVITRVPISTQPLAMEISSQNFVTEKIHDFSELLEGIDAESMEVTPVSTPQSSSTSKKFYATSPQSKNPISSNSNSVSSPSPVRRNGPGISNRGLTTRSSPYSLISQGAMPIVVSTPTKQMTEKISSPSRGLRSPSTPISTPTSNSSVAPKKPRAAFTSPAKLTSAESEEYNSDQLLKPSKHVVYGRSSSNNNEKVEKTVKHTSEPLFNIYPSEEQRSARKKLSALGRAPHRLTRSQLLAYKIRPDVIDMTSDSAKLYYFERLDEHGSLVKLGAEEMMRVMLAEGASKKILKSDWIENHFRWIVWKLASMERSFPQEFAGVYLTPERTLAQLKYRYERELNLAQRPPIRKVLEHDAPAGAHMVLIVSSIRHDGLADKSMRVTADFGAIALGGGQQIEEDEENFVKGPLAIVEVTDGWYCVNALCDPYLTRLVQDGSIFAGQKLHIFGSNLIGNDAPTPPLEITASTMLKLNYNGVKRAKWDARLGFQRVALPSVRLSSLKIGGGNAPKIDAVILRVYPLIFSEEVIITPQSNESDQSSGSRRNATSNAEAQELSPVMRVSRTPYGEDIALERFLKKKEDWVERKIRELTIEILEETKISSSKNSASSTRNASSEEDSEHSNANQFFYDESSLSNAQREKLEERLKEAMELEPWLDRQVTCILRVLICDYPGTKGAAFEVMEHLRMNGAEGLMTLTAAQSKALHSLGKSILTIYNVNEESLARFKEGTRIQASYVNWKGEPFLAPRQTPPTFPNASEMQSTSSNSHAFNNFSSAEDAMAMPESISETVHFAPLPRLSTTNYTSFEFPTNNTARRNVDSISNMLSHSRAEPDSMVKTISSLFGRVATPFEALDTRIRFRDYPVPQNAYDIDIMQEYERRRLIDRFTVSNEFDGVGVVVSVGKRELMRKCKLAVEEDLNAIKDEYQLDIFLGDPSGQLLVIRAETILDNLPPSVFEIGSLLCFKNVLYSSYDSHAGIHSATSTDATEWITKSPSAVANPSLKSRRDELLQWTQTNEFSDAMELLSSKIIDIQSSAASRNKPGANLANSVFRK